MKVRVRVQRRPSPESVEPARPPKQQLRSTGQPVDAGVAIAQARLAVGPTDDRFEREADATAQRVVSSIAATRPGPRGESSTSSRPARVQRAAPVDGVGSPLDEDTDTRIKRAQRSGRPLDRGIRRVMEPAFGTDFSAVRVHEGSSARDLNDRIQATAFTVGSDVFFRDGVPDVSSKSGQALIAHELTHTIRQSAGGRTAQRVQRFTNPFKRDKPKEPVRNYGTTIKPRTGATPPASGPTVPTLSINSRALSTVGGRSEKKSKPFKKLVGAVSSYELVVGTSGVANALDNLEEIRSQGISWLEANPRPVGKNRWQSAANARDDKEELRALVEHLVFANALRVQTMLTSGDDGLAASGTGPTSGSVSAVSVYHDAQGNKSFFKRYEYADDQADAADAARDAGIGAQLIGEDQSQRAFLANRAVASAKLDELFGFGIVPKTEFSVKNGVFGTMQAGASGYAPQEAIKMKTERDPDPHSTAFLRVDTNDKGLYNDPALMKNLNTLQLFDAITGQVDRHPGNYFIERVGTDVRVAAIDNDLSFGKFNYRSGTDGSKQHVGIDVKGGMAKALPTFIDRGVVDRALRVSADDVRTTLRPLLPPAEVDYTVQRWELISGRLQAMKDSHRIVRMDEWQRLASTQKLLAAGNKGMDSYAGVLATKADAAHNNTTDGVGTAMAVGTSASDATKLLTALKVIHERVDGESRRAGSKAPDGEEYTRDNEKMLTVDEAREVRALLGQLAALDPALVDSNMAYHCRKHLDRFLGAIHWAEGRYARGRDLI